MSHMQVGCASQHIAHGLHVTHFYSLACTSLLLLFNVPGVEHALVMLLLHRVVCRSSDAKYAWDKMGKWQCRSTNCSVHSLSTELLQYS
jgi:hypothetical protein